jgi:hypothetical protein
VGAVTAYLQKLTSYGNGALDITRHYPETPGDGPGWITIGHADPRITITHDMLEMIDRGECQPFARILKLCDCRPRLSSCGHFRGAKLEIRGQDRGVVYIVGEADFCSMTWPAEWPD